MTLRDGRFYNDSGDIIPLEFGNKDQIRLIDNVSILKEEGAVPRFVYAEANRPLLVGISLICVCGGHIDALWLDSEEVEDQIGRKIDCPICSFTFSVCSDEYGMPYFRITGKHKLKVFTPKGEDKLK